MRANDKRNRTWIKADAYGHGAIPVASALRKAGADYFAVATPEEALQLWRSGIDEEILLLGTVMPGNHARRCRGTGAANQQVYVLCD